MLATRWICPLVLGPTAQLCLGNNTITSSAAAQSAPSSEPTDQRTALARPLTRAAKIGERTEREGDHAEVEDPARCRSARIR